MNQFDEFLLKIFGCEEVLGYNQMSLETLQIITSALKTKCFCGTDMFSSIITHSIACGSSWSEMSRFVYLLILYLLHGCLGM